MTDTEQRMAAKAFAEHWKGRGYEKGESQSFWIELLQTVYGIENGYHGDRYSVGREENSILLQ